jgi:hypothetical protein
MKKLFYRLLSNRSFVKLFSILAFAVLASWLAPAPVAGYTYCEHRNSTTNVLIGKHCPPCSTTHGTNRKDVAKTALGATCMLAGANAFMGMSHTGREYRCTSVEGSGAIIDDPDFPGTLSWDFGISDPADLATCTEFVDGIETSVANKGKGLFTISGVATGVNSSCASVTGEAPIVSRRTYTASCNKDQTATVSQTITLDEAATFAEFGYLRPAWCSHPGICQLQTVGPPDDGLPTNNSGSTTEKLCADAFTKDGLLVSKQMVLYSVGFGSANCPDSGVTHVAGETFRARGCQTQSWDPTMPISAQDCVLTVSGKPHTHLSRDIGSAGSQCGPGSGVVQGSFKEQTCSTSGVVKYRCFSQPETELASGDEVSAFNVRVVDLDAGTATLNGVSNKKPGTFNASQGMVEFTFPQCAVAAATSVVNGEADFLFKAKTEQGGFVIDSDTESAQ